MTNNFLSALILSIIYLLFKFIDMRYIKKENKPLKELIIDSFIVFISSLITSFLFSQFNLSDILNGQEKVADAFIDNPAF
jgi:cytochrome bd-type quinol oxidase subunit 2